MPVLPVRTTRDSALGRTQTTTEVHTPGSRTTNTGAQTITDTVATPEVVSTKVSSTPEVAVVSRTPVHAGVKFSMTLKFKDHT